MERKNPDFVNVEQANKTLTGFRQDSTRRMFIGEQRKRYTILGCLGALVRQRKRGREPKQSFMENSWNGTVKNILKNGKK